MIQELLNLGQCSCGKNHTLLTNEYIIEKDAIAKLPALLSKLGVAANPLAVFDENTFQAAYAKLSAAFPGIKTEILRGQNIHADESHVAAVHAAIKASAPTVLLAVGAGVLCDTVRYAAFEANTPFIAVPTAASVDGFVSSVSAMSFNNAKVTLPTRAPLAVVADLAVIAAAPKKLAASGVGDMLSKYISIADWKIGHLISGEYFCPRIAQIELNAVDGIVASLSDIAQGGLEGTRKLIEGLLLSGIAMQMAEISRPASSFEHHFSHYLEVVPVPGVDGDALHGEKVGIATVIAAKYYPLFAAALRRIFEENLSNRFDMDKVISYYSAYSQGLVDQVIAENTPTCTDALNPSLLRQNYREVQKIAASLPSAEQMREWIQSIGGYHDYRQIGLNASSTLEILKTCCYIRNRFTMLRIVCDYSLYEFDALLI